MRTHRFSLRGTLALGLTLVAGCLPFGPGGNGNGGGGDGQQAKDIAQWDSLVAQYDARRSPFLDNHVQDLAPVGNTLYWYNTSNFQFALRRYDDTTGAKVSYGFAVGDNNTAFYRASSTVVVTVEGGTDPVVYHAWDASQPKKELANTTSPKPAGASYNAFSVDGGAVYILDTSVPGTSALMKWVPGQPQTRVTTLEAAGVQVGEFMDFGVDGNTMIFVESGRIWKLDLAANKATWLMNKTEVHGRVDFRADGVMFESASGIMFFDYATGGLVNLTAKINANPYQVNATYSSSSHYSNDFSRWKNYMLYIGGGGLFAYNWTADTITPILLSPHTGNDRTDYRYPVALDDGTAFVTGLMSASGSTGADGPTFKLDLKPILR